MRVGSANRGILLGVAAIWGLNFVSATYALESFTPWTLRVVSFLAGAAILLVFAVARGARLKLSHPREALHLVIAGAFSVAGFGALSALALLNTTAGRASICLYLMPIWVALFSRIVLKEKLGRSRTIAVFTGLSGLVVLLYPLLQSGFSFGVLAATGAGLSWAIGTVYLKWARVSAHQLTVTIWQLVAGGLISVIGALLWQETLPSQLTPHAWVGIIYTTVMGTAVAYLLWFGAIARLPASTAGLGTLLVPVFGMLASVALLGERPTLTDVVGFMLIFIAGLLALPARRKITSAHTSHTPRRLS